MPEQIQRALYLVPTPIGNVNDLSKRAYKILSDADIIACEDTRTSGNLLKKYKIKPKKLISYHEHNEEQAAQNIIDHIFNEKSVALISDAGMPSISDPGFRVVRLAIEKQVKIIPLPGSTALIPALAGSGMPVHAFAFAGFAPQKKGRKAYLEKFLNLDITTIYYESPYRLQKFFEEINELAGPARKICIAREISKLNEEFIRGTVKEILELLNQGKKIKGEIVIVVEPNKG